MVLCEHHERERWREHKEVKERCVVHHKERWPRSLHHLAQCTTTQCNTTQCIPTQCNTAQCITTPARIMVKAVYQSYRKKETKPASHTERMLMRMGCFTPPFPPLIETEQNTLNPNKFSTTPRSESVLSFMVIKNERTEGIIKAWKRYPQRTFNWFNWLIDEKHLLTELIQVRRWRYGGGRVLWGSWRSCSFGEGLWRGWHWLPGRRGRGRWRRILSFNVTRQD